VAVILRSVGRDGDGTLDQLTRRSHLPHLKRQNAQKMQRIGMIRIAGKHVLISALRPGKIAGLMELEAFFD